MNYQTHLPGNGIYAMVVEGQMSIDQTVLNKRDALGVWDQTETEFKALVDSQVMVIEIPMIF